MWYTKGALISLSHGFVKYQSPYDLLGSFIVSYLLQFVQLVFILGVILHPHVCLLQVENLLQPGSRSDPNFPVFMQKLHENAPQLRGKEELPDCIHAVLEVLQELATPRISFKTDHYNSRKFAIL